MKTINQFLKKLFTIEHLVHLVMILFAAASLANVATFFSDAGHATVGWALGSALGSALVAVSIMATKIDRSTEPETFRIIAFAVLMLALLSGAIQSRAYSLHLPITWSVMLDFGLPVCGEALLAFACAEYSQAIRRKRIRHATDGTEERIAEAIAGALSDVDVTQVKRHVQKQVDSIVRFKVGEVAASMMGGNAVTIDKTVYASTQDFPDMRRSNTPKSRATVDNMNAAKDEKIAQRRATIHQHADGQEVRAFVGQIAKAVGVSRDTVRRGIKALEGAGRLIVNGSVIKAEQYATA